jgi:hypothetical protein
VAWNGSEAVGTPKMVSKACLNRVTQCGRGTALHTYAEIWVRRRDVECCCSPLATSEAHSDCGRVPLCSVTVRSE